MGVHMAVKGASPKDQPIQIGCYIDHDANNLDPSFVQTSR